MFKLKSTKLSTQVLESSLCRPGLRLPWKNPRIFLIFVLEESDDLERVYGRKKRQILRDFPMLLIYKLMNNPYPRSAPVSPRAIP